MKAKAVARWDNEGGAPASGDVSARKRSSHRQGGLTTTSKSTPVMVRLQPDQLAALDAYIARQPDPRPSRAEAVRHVLMGAITRPPDWPDVSKRAKG
jgi:hypothetical protein